MKYRAAFTAAAVASCFAGTAALTQPSDVVVLTAKNFSETVKPAKVMLVEFYAPWCGHCQALAPEYEKAATELKLTNITLAKVDCTVEESLCKEYGVRGYPTLKVFREGDTSNYNGERTVDSIVPYMKRQSMPAIRELTEDNINEFKESEDVVVVGFFDKSDTDEQKTLLAVAKKIRDDFTIGAIVNSKVAKKFGSKTPGLILFKKFDEGSNKFDGNWEEDTVTAFIRTNAIPLVAELSAKNYPEYTRSKLPLGYIFFETDEQRKALIPMIEKVARDFKGKINFVSINAAQHGKHAESLNLKETWPAFVIHDLKSEAKYPFAEDQEITEEAVRTLAQQILDGTAVPSIKSEPVPTDNDGPVTVVVADIFDKIVKDPTKDVLIEFYAPWCGHCQMLAPIYEELGSLYKAADDIVIAKMDATANDLPPGIGFRIDGFPTIKLFKARGDEADEDKKIVVDYSGDRSLDSFIKFITDNAVSKFTPSKDSAAKEEVPEDLPHDEL